MSKHKDEDVEALRLAAIAYAEVHPAHENIDRWKALKSALAKFEPKPEKVYVLDENQRQVVAKWIRQIWDDLVSGKIINHDTTFDELRELTAVNATTAPVQKYNMPAFAEINNGEDYIGLPDAFSNNGGQICVSRHTYIAFRDKIMSMNEVK
jgi:aminopeptidase N